jgi:hypothetical protein
VIVGSTWQHHPILFTGLGLGSVDPTTAQRHSSELEARTCEHTTHHAHKDTIHRWAHAHHPPPHRLAHAQAINACTHGRRRTPHTNARAHMHAGSVVSKSSADSSVVDGAASTSASAISSAIASVCGGGSTAKAAANAAASAVATAVAQAYTSAKAKVTVTGEVWVCGRGEV